MMNEVACCKVGCTAPTSIVVSLSIIATPGAPLHRAAHPPRGDPSRRWAPRIREGEASPASAYCAGAAAAAVASAGVCDCGGQRSTDAWTTLAAEASAAVCGGAGAVCSHGAQ